MVEIERMRADFPLAALVQDWSSEDQAEIGAAIKAALDAGDQDALAYWAQHLATAAAEWRAWCALVRAMERRIRADGEAQRRAAK